MFRYAMLGALLALGACAAPQENQPDLAPGVDTGFFIEGGLIRGSYTPADISRDQLQSTIREQCPRFGRYQELPSYTPGVIGFTARCR